VPTAVVTLGRVPRRALAASRRRPPSPAAALSLTLPYRPPLDAGALLAFLRERAIPGVERVEDGVYRRTHGWEGGTALVEVRPVAGAAEARLEVAPRSPAADLVPRARRLLDLDADPAAIASALAADPALRASVRARPGLRVPGAWDGFELAVRAILGQQISVQAATALSGRLVQLCGQPLPAPAGGLTHLFPTPAALAALDPGRLPVPRARAAALIALARAVARGEVDLRGRAGGLEASVAALRQLPGIGPWTAHYVAMRALGERDAFPSGDLGIRRALGAGGKAATEAEALERAERWRPWRAYAAMHLWAGLAAGRAKAAAGPGRAARRARPVAAAGHGRRRPR